MIDDFGVIVQCFNYIAFGFLFLVIVEIFLCIIFCWCATKQAV